MTTFAELFCRVEASDLPEDVKETAIGALFDESMRNRGIVFASPEQRADVYSRVRAAIRKEFVKGTK